MFNRIASNCGGQYLKAQKIIGTFIQSSMYATQKSKASTSIPVVDSALKYDEYTTKRILCVLNDADAEQLERYVSKPRVLEIMKYRETNGPFENIGQILKIKTFGVKVLRKFVKSVADNAFRRTTIHRNPKKISRLLNTLAIPVLDPEQRSIINTVTGISIGVHHISWAKIDSQGNVLCWESYDDFEWPKKDNPIALHDLALKIRSKLPGSDIYVTRGTPTPKLSLETTPEGMLWNLERVQLTAMLVTLLATELNTSNEDGAARWIASNNFFFVKREVPSQLFRLLIGDETVSACNVIDQIRNSTIAKACDYTPPVFIKPRENNFYERSSLEKREELSQSLLVSVAFMDLIVKCNPLSLGAIQTTPKKRYFN